MTMSLRRARAIGLLVALLTSGCATGELRHAPPEPPAPPPPVQVGTASIYASRFQGLRTASGERYDRRRLTAAHRWLPMGTRLLVTNLANERTVIVTVNDRGPMRRSRILDLSASAARALAIGREGLAQVRIEVVD